MEIGSFEIRRATPADMLGVADLLAEWPGHEEEAQMIRRGWMSEDLLHWVAADDSCVVGCSRVTMSNQRYGKVSEASKTSAKAGCALIWHSYSLAALRGEAV